jgi:hypothetical protein
VTQVHAHRAAVGGWGGAQLVQRGGLELDDSRLVDLVHHGSGRPGQPVGAGVQPVRQDHRLADTTVGRLDEEVIEEAGPHGHHVPHALHPPLAVVVDLGGVEFASGQPGEELHPDRADQRFGEGIVDQRVGAPAGQRAPDRDSGGSGTHAGGQIPSVVVRSCHACPSFS